jgi:hypothetical protein
MLFGFFQRKKWTLIFFVDDQARYEMKCASIVVMLGYLIDHFLEARQKSGTKIIVYSRRTKRRGELSSAWFDKTDVLSSFGLTELNRLDSSWLGEKGDPIFIDLATNARIPLTDEYIAKIVRTGQVDPNDIAKMFVRMLSEDEIPRTFFDVMQSEFFF